MICPVCHYENLQGLDNCENCGADLRTADIPQPGNAFELLLVDVPLAELEPRQPVTIAAGETAAAAVRRMQDEQIGCVLVVDGERLVGVFTEHDALLKLAGTPMDGVTVDEVMTPDPVVLRHQDNVAVAIHKMAVGGFRHIPLVEDGAPTGIVTSRDIFRHILAILG